MPLKPPTFKPMPRITARHYNVSATAEPETKSSAKKGYGYRWQKARAGYLAKYPLCRECEKRGIVKEATELDHIIPHRHNWDLFWDYNNWQPLCKACHSRKTAREDGGFGNRRTNQQNSPEIA